MYCTNPVRHGPEYKGNMDFTEVLCKFFLAYHYKPSLTYLQLEFNNRQTFETEQIFIFPPKVTFFKLNCEREKTKFIPKIVPM